MHKDKKKGITKCKLTTAGGCKMTMEKNFLSQKDKLIITRYKHLKIKNKIDLKLLGNTISVASYFEKVI